MGQCGFRRDIPSDLSAGMGTPSIRPAKVSAQAFICLLAQWLGHRNSKHGNRELQPGASNR